LDERLGVVIVFDLDSWEIFAAVLLAMLSISARALADEMTSNDWFLIGQELYGAGSYEEAVAAYDEAIAMEPDKGTLQFFKGNALYALAMASGFDLPISAGAIDAYEEAVRLDPTSAKPWWGKARVLSLISNSLEGDERAEVMEKALSAIKMATEIDPFFVDAWICRGRILDELAALTRDFCRYDQSLQAYERAIELLPFSDARSLALAWDGKVVALSHLAQDLADGDEGEEDLDIREEAAFAHGGVIGLGSESPGLEVRLKRARGFANLGRYDDAIDAYDEAADCRPRRSSGVRRPRPRREGGRPSGDGRGGAILGVPEGSHRRRPWERDGLEKEGGSPLGFGPAIRGRGCPLQGAGAGGEGIISAFFFKFYGAKELKVSELRNRYPTVGFWAISALLLAALAASWATASAEEKSVANSSESWRERGDELWADGSLEEALEAYDKSLLIDPENGDVWLGKALILDILGNTSESQEAYREAVDAFDEDLKVDPEDAQSWWGMGVALDSLGRREEATEAREKAAFIFNQTLEENPDDAETWFDMAEVLVGLLRREEAIEAYGKAIELNSTKADYAAISQGVLLQELGRYDESLVAFDRAIELIPEYDAQMLATVWYHKANSLDNNNRPKEALEAYDVVTELDPGEQRSLARQRNYARRFGHVTTSR